MAEQVTPFSRFLPGCTFYERHEAPVAGVAPARIIDAVATFDMRSDPVVDTLLRVREWPARLAQHIGGAARERFGFGTFTLLHRDEHELSLGLAGRFWRPDFGLVDVANADAFLALARRDVAKLVVRFRVNELGVGESRLITETFVHCPSWHTKAMMTPYWIAIRASSGWIRRRTLASVARALAAQR
ncbi:hypothetical protein [Paraburkholderia pallida]|uniref:DUF2867 domain-containing protein n=1 Tax=Paraburkholderia pallida TaxID=2547399 RepID=A0A4V1AZ48_9BURK|nr:hypothetical protein [Paraburkholderia pallida]QBQ98022.1 hypothetical protein E1956_13155 [Paraburkholderia pallida]